MSTKEVRANFADLLGSVYYTKEPVIVERKGKPVAVVISPDEYACYQQAEEERLWQVVERIQERNADKDPDAVLLSQIYPPPCPHPPVPGGAPPDPTGDRVGHAWYATTCMLLLTLFSVPEIAGCRNCSATIARKPMAVQPL